MLKRTILAAVFYATASAMAIPALVQAQELETLLPQLSATRLAELREKGLLVDFFDKPPTFSLMPAIPTAAQIKKHFAGQPANVTDEALFLLPAPDQPAPETMLITLYKALRVVSSLSGIEYWSNHYKQLRVLFSDVYEVRSNERRDRIPDPVVTAMPETDQTTVHIKDVNFGDGYYLATYQNAGGVSSFGLVNLTTLWYAIIPVIGERELRMQIVVVPLKAQLLVYGVCAVKANDLVKGMVDLPSAFLTRIRALKDWFQKRYEAVRTR